VTTDVLPVRQTLLLEIHRIIASTASHAVAGLGASSTPAALTYPPGAGLSESESRALQGLMLSDVARAALTKVVADACASAFFEFLCQVDGVADPEVRPSDRAWLGARIVEPTEDQDQEMWHDDLFESFWEYARARDRE
jgi:hypothetical protein